FAFIEPPVDAARLDWMVLFIRSRGERHGAFVALRLNLPVGHRFIKCLGFVDIRSRDLKKTDLVFHARSPFLVSGFSGGFNFVSTFLPSSHAGRFFWWSDTLLTLYSIVVRQPKNRQLICCSTGHRDIDRSGILFEHLRVR